MLVSHVVHSNPGRAKNRTHFSVFASPLPPHIFAIFGSRMFMQRRKSHPPNPRWMDINIIVTSKGRTAHKERLRNCTTSLHFRPESKFAAVANSVEPNLLFLLRAHPFAESREQKDRYPSMKMILLSRSGGVSSVILHRANQ